MLIPNENSQNYMHVLNVLDNQVGRWFSTAYLDVLTASAQLDVGAGNITGELYFEVTADPQALKGVSPVVLPPGCLHTQLAGVALATPATVVNVIAATTGAFTVSFSKLGVGQMRIGWRKTGGSGGAPNTITLYVQARRTDEE